MNGPRRFLQDFVSAHRQRFGKRPPQDRQLTYDIAVEDEYAGWRRWLDDELAVLPERTSEALAKKLWLDEHFWPVNFELATGAGLRTAGLRVEYERAWEGLSPRLDPPVRVGQSARLSGGAHRHARAADFRADARSAVDLNRGVVHVWRSASKSGDNFSAGAAEVLAVVDRRRAAEVLARARRPHTLRAGSLHSPTAWRWHIACSGVEASEYPETT